MNRQCQKVIILGGGTAGWMTAAALGRYFGQSMQISLIESDDIGIVGVGEATVPAIRQFNALLNLREDEFIRATKATYKLGIRFLNWQYIGHDYFHPFGTYGLGLELGQFHQIYMKSILSGSLDINQYPLESYSICAQAALAHKSAAYESDPASPYSRLHSAYHFDATQYGQYMRGLAEKSGVNRIEGEVKKVMKNPETGYISSLQLSSEKSIEGDFFIDCSGFRSLLLGNALNIDYIDWSHWLPMDAAFAQPCENSGPTNPYTTSSATEGGWTWRIPLQHRTGNGHVFCTNFLSNDKALSILGNALKGKPLSDARLIRFKAGKRKTMWSKNVVAIGLSCGFLEPLESTSIYFIQSAIQKLIQHFPDKSFSPINSDLFNKRMMDDYDHVRDVIILHYHLTQRNDSELWNYVRNMSIPDTLIERIELFKERGHIFSRNEEMFGLASWMAIMWGQGLKPKSLSPIIMLMDDEVRQRTLNNAKNEITNLINALPLHDDFYRKHGLIL
jgi:tryptophan halogenase